MKPLTEIKKDCKEDLGRELTITEDILIKLVFVYSQKALLEQAQEFEKMIEELKKGLRGFSVPTQYGVIKLIDKIFSKELLKEVQGDKK